MIGMVVRAKRQADIGSFEAFRARCSRRSPPYSDSGSGTYLSTTLFAKLRRQTRWWK
jgi:molybdate transport system substrate-binding protein